MGLPQEVIDYILDMLYDDLRTLKACSLTCKAMFASTRHLIYQTLCLSHRNNQKVLTKEEKEELRHKKLDHRDLELRFLSYMGEHGLLQYARRIDICGLDKFTPDILLPHLHYFQSLDRIHTFVIEHYDASSWADYYTTCFVHFYPTLTSLTLCQPVGHHHLLWRFALQFPNLESLCLEWLQDQVQTQQYPPIPAIVDQFPPLRGRLRLAFGAGIQWVVQFTNNFKRGFNFQSVELESDFFGNHSQNIINACARTLEDLTITAAGTGTLRLSYLSSSVAGRFTNFLPIGSFKQHRPNFTEITLLRRLTVRMPFRQAMTIEPYILLQTLSSIASPVFREFVIELPKLLSQFEDQTLQDWGHWVGIDKYLEGRFSRHRDFRLTIRTDKPYDQATFQRYARIGFPLMARRRCLHFERLRDRG